MAKAETKTKKPAKKKEKKFKIKLPKVSELFKAGAYRGHKKERKNSGMEKFIYATRSGFSIIDLTKTLECLEKTCQFLAKSKNEGKIILFVGTKKQAKEFVKKAAKDSEMPYVVERWLGGMLTNFETVRKNIDKLKQIEEDLKSEKKGLTKKEKSQLKEGKNKIKAEFGGILAMKKLPDALLIFDAVHDELALLEAKKLNIPVVALTDTNSKVNLIDYPVPANDDATASIEIFAKTFAEATEAGKK